jgi:hypothetical protein
MKFDIWAFFENPSRDFVALICDKNNVYLMCRTIYIFDHISLNYSRMRNASDKRRMLCSITFFNRTVYNRFSKNILLFIRADDKWQYGACPLHAGYQKYKHTHTHTLRICNTYRFSSERASMLRYTYIACLFRCTRRKIRIRFLYVIARVKSYFG